MFSLNIKEIQKNKLIVNIYCIYLNMVFGYMLSYKFPRSIVCSSLFSI